MIKRLCADRRGDIWAFFAVALVFIGLPLASLTIDVVRGMYVRTHLQIATDAACQAAADALDTVTFQASGLRQINHSRGRSQAIQVFNATLGDAGKVGFTPSLSVGFPSATRAYCQASASIYRLIPLTPMMTAVVETTSEMRVVLNP
jgi:hypothetical protein